MKMMFKMGLIIVVLVLTLDFMSGMVGQSVFFGDNSVLATNGVGTHFINEQSNTIMNFIDLKVGEVFESFKNISGLDRYM